MIIFIAYDNISKKELKRLRRHLDETYPGVVIIVTDTDTVKVERE